MDGNKILTGVRTAAEATGLTLLNVYVWIAPMLSVLNQLAALVLSVGSIYVMYLRIKEYHKKKGGNDGNDISIG